MTSRLRPLYPQHVPTASSSPFQLSLLTLGSAFASLRNTHRHDMVATLSETTSHLFLPRLLGKMYESKSGREIMRDRPRITEKSLGLESLRGMKEGTLGRTYADWLRKNKVTPDTRDPVRYLPNEEQAYLMQRYRESHDLYHVILGFGVSLPSELVVKWFELSNFSLPVAFLSSVFGPLRMETSERRRLMDTYAGWALRSGGKADCLIGVYWEKEWEKDLNTLRKELGVEPPPLPIKEWFKEGKRLKQAREGQV